MSELFSFCILCKKIEKKLNDISDINNNIYLYKFQNELKLIYDNYIKCVKINKIYNQYGLFQLYEIKIKSNYDIIKYKINKLIEKIVNNNYVEYKKLKISYLINLKNDISKLYYDYTDVIYKYNKQIK
jgi:hypothetical protein